MPSVNQISFTAPNTTPQAPAMPRSRSELMAYLLERGAPATPDYGSVQSPVEGFAKMLTSGLQGYMGKKALQGEEDKKLANANTFADLLMGPTADGSPDPRRDQLVQYLMAGGDAGAVSGKIATNLGLGEPPERWEPTEQFGLKGQRSTTTNKFDPFPGAEPAKPYSNEAEVWADWKRGFFPTEADRDAALANLGKAGVSVNVGQGEVGTIPPGFELVTDPVTGARSMRQIPGGPEDTAAKDAAKQQTETRAADIVTQDIDRALSIIETSPGSTTGIGGALLQNIPDTQARDLRGLIDTVKSNVGFDKLQFMRENSPTGGALGQVSDFENRLLQSTIGNLEQSQSMAQLRDNLNRVWNVYNDIIHGPGNGPPRRKLGFQDDDDGYTVEPLD